MSYTSSSPILHFFASHTTGASTGSIQSCASLLPSTARNDPLQMIRRSKQFTSNDIIWTYISELSLNAQPWYNREQTWCSFPHWTFVSNVGCTFFCRSNKPSKLARHFVLFPATKNKDNSVDKGSDRKSSTKRFVGKMSSLKMSSSLISVPCYSGACHFQSNFLSRCIIIVCQDFFSAITYSVPGERMEKLLSTIVRCKFLTESVLICVETCASHTGARSTVGRTNLRD